MSIKYIFNKQIINKYEGILFHYLQGIYRFFLYKLRQFMTHFKSCTSKMNSMSGVGQCL